MNYKHNACAAVKSRQINFLHNINIIFEIKLLLIVYFLLHPPSIFNNKNRNGMNKERSLEDMLKILLPWVLKDLVSPPK